MLEIKLTPKHAGVVIWGDIWALNGVYELIHRVNENSPIIENKEGFFLGLAYDLRKAFEGQRKKDKREFFEDRCRIYGVEILWPVIVSQVGLLRASMAFIPTTRHAQSIAYELESLIESAAREDLPGREEQIMEQMRRIGEAQTHVEKVIESRCHYFIDFPPKDRLRMLPAVLDSLDPMFEIMGGRRVSADPSAAIPRTTFAKYTDDLEWPEFKW